MKIKKVLEQLDGLINAKTKRVVKKKKKIKGLLQQLKEEKRQIKADLEVEQDRDKARQMRRKLKIIKSERHKGIDMLKEAMAKSESEPEATAETEPQDTKETKQADSS